MSGKSNLTTHRTYRIPNGIVSRIQHLAKQLGLTESKFVISVLTEYLDNRKTK